MPKTAKRIVLVVAAFIVVVFAIFLFNQTMQIVQSARAVNIVFGNGVMWGLIFTYCRLLVALRLDHQHSACAGLQESKP